MAVVEPGVPGREYSVSFKDVAPSHLPSFILPCPHCGHRMAITAVTPAWFNGDAESGNLEDITHGCVQCGTTLTRTVRPLAEDDQKTALRA
jgi:phage terminase large subunit GpA-like protein